MYNAIKLGRVNDKFQDPLYLFLELVRAGVMHGHLWSGRAFSGGPSFGTGMYLVAYFGLISCVLVGRDWPFEIGVMDGPARPSVMVSLG